MHVAQWMDDGATTEIFFPFLEAFPAVPVYSTNRRSVDASDWLIVTNEEKTPTIRKAKRQRRFRGVRDCIQGLTMLSSAVGRPRQRNCTPTEPMHIKLLGMLYLASLRYLRYC